MADVEVPRMRIQIGKDEDDDGSEEA